MRINYLLLLLMIPFLNSCSDDDEVIEPILENKLEKVTSSLYSKGDIYLTIEDFYKNNKIISTNKLNDKLELIGTIEYQYNSEGLISNIKYYWSGNLGEEFIFLYDDKNRLTSLKKHQPETIDQDFFRTFDYTQNNIIIENQKDLNGEPIAFGKFEYYLNVSGLIYKIINEEEVYEAFFEGNNIKTVNTPHSGSYTFFYDDINTTQGDFYNNLVKNIFGEKINNAALWASSLMDMVEIYNNKFIKQKRWSDINLDISFELNEEGYPKIRTESIGGITTKQIEYSYE